MATAPRSLLVPLLASLSLTTALGASVDTESACKALYAQYPDHFAWDPLGPNALQTLGQVPQYTSANTDYWNENNHENRAACTFFPGSADEVSHAVKVLNNYTSVQYALKSGGHNANLGFSSVDQGVLIAFRPNLASTTISADGNSADVGPGSKWEEAISALNPHGKAVVGGRIGHVGVGGYVLGGGLSFLSAQHGFTADTLINVECVLADGTIINANRTSNSDIFYAMQGGGNQFGIVTKYTLKTFDISPQVWGGSKLYAGTDHQTIYGATANFTANNKDPKAAVIVTTDYTIDGLVAVIVLFFFYDGATPPAGVFDDFDAINPLIDQTKTQSYPDLLTGNDQYSLSGFNYQIREGTYPNMPYENMTDFLNYHYNFFMEQAAEKGAMDLDLQVISFAIQPIPVGLIDASNAQGGNRLGLDSANGDRIFMEYDISWLNPLCNGQCPEFIEQMQNDVLQHHKETYEGVAPTNYKSGDLSFTNYNPIFMNDGMYDQEVLQSYGDATYQQLKQVQQNRDPNGFFSQRQGGFKFT